MMMMEGSLDFATKYFEGEMMHTPTPDKDILEPINQSRLAGIGRRRRRDSSPNKSGEKAKCDHSNDREAPGHALHLGELNYKGMSTLEFLESLLEDELDEEYELQDESDQEEDNDEEVYHHASTADIGLISLPFVAEGVVRLRIDDDDDDDDGEESEIIIESYVVDSVGVDEYVNYEIRVFSESSEEELDCWLFVKEY